MGKRWTAAEDARLLELVEEYGETPTGKVKAGFFEFASTRLPNRPRGSMHNRISELRMKKRAASPAMQKEEREAEAIIRATAGPGRQLELSDAHAARIIELLEAILVDVQQLNMHAAAVVQASRQ